MHRLDLPAGSPVRLSATARIDSGPHRWAIQVFSDADAAGASAPRLSYGSQIGGADREQRIDIPAQDVDCRLEIHSRHEIVGGWADDRCAVNEDTPALLALGFSDPGSPPSPEDDVRLSFDFRQTAGS